MLEPLDHLLRLVQIFIIAAIESELTEQLRAEKRLKQVEESKKDAQTNP